MGDASARNGRREQRPSFQFYPGDFLASPKVRRMSPAARGAYITLLCDQWLGGPLEADTQSLADRVGMDLEEFEREWAGPLGRCFDVLPDGRVANPRMEAERAVAEERSRRLAEAGSRGGKVKATPQPSEAPPMPGEGPATEGASLAKPGCAERKPGLAQAKPSGMGWDGVGWDGTGCAGLGPEGEPEREPAPDPSPKSPRRAKGAACSLEEQLAEVEFSSLRSDVVEAARTWSAYRRERRVSAWGPAQWRPALRRAIGDPAGFGRAVAHSVGQKYQGLIWDRGPAINGGSRHQTVADLFEAGREAARMLGESFDGSPTHG